MSITDIKFRRIFPSGKLRAIVSVTFDDMFVVHDIKVIEGRNGLFVAMPNRKTKHDVYKDICHPINSQARLMIEGAILEAFRDRVKSMDEGGFGSEEAESSGNGADFKAEETKLELNEDGE